MISVNKLCNDAAQQVSLLGDGETLEGEQADRAVALLNSAIRKLNTEAYFASTVDQIDRQASSVIVFKQLTDDERADPETASRFVDMAPPEYIQGVARKLGIRYYRLRNCDPKQLDNLLSGGLPAYYTYSVSSEPTPDGDSRRLVGILRLNGNASCQLRVYFQHRLSVTDIDDYVCVSDIYHDALYWTLCYMLCQNYHLDDYKQDSLDQMNAALALIDRQTLNNRAMLSGDEWVQGYDTWSVGYDLGGGYIGE